MREALTQSSPRKITTGGGTVALGQSQGSLSKLSELRSSCTCGGQKHAGRTSNRITSFFRFSIRLITAESPLENGASQRDRLPKYTTQKMSTSTTATKAPGTANMDWDNLGDEYRDGECTPSDTHEPAEHSKYVGWGRRRQALKRQSFSLVCGCGSLRRFVLIHTLHGLLDGLLMVYSVVLHHRPRSSQQPRQESEKRVLVKKRM